MAEGNALDNSVYSYETIELFKNTARRKISIGLINIPDLSESKSTLQSKIIQVRDVTEPSRHVIIDFDLEGRLRNIELGRKSYDNKIKILERSIDGTLYEYPANCENLKPKHNGIYSYYDYYEEDVCKELKIAEFLVRSVTSLLADIFRSDYRTTENMLFTELRVVENEIDSDNEIQQLPENLIDILKNAYSCYNWEGLIQDRALFQKIYSNPIGVLPPEIRPDKNSAFALIKMTQGCWIQNSTRGPCKFCHSYNGVSYREKCIDELKEHICRVKKYTGRGWKYVRKLFLLDADPFHTELDSEVYLKLLNKKIPEAIWYEAFVSTSTILSKSEFQWRKLKSLGLKRLYWGVESAEDKILMLLGKPQNKELLYKAAYRLNSAGVPYAAIVMSGIDSLETESDRINTHIKETIKFISDTKCPIVYFSKFVPLYGTEIFDKIKSGELQCPSLSERERQHRIMIKMAVNDATEVRGTYGRQFV